MTVKDLRIEMVDGRLEIDHPQLRWDNFLEVFRNFGSGGPKAEVSVAVPRTVALTLGVVSASALVSGLRTDVRLNTVSGDIIVDGLQGDVDLNAVSGDVQVRELEGALSANSVSGDDRGHRPHHEGLDRHRVGRHARRLDRCDAGDLAELRQRHGDRPSRPVAPRQLRLAIGERRVQIDGQVRSGKGPTNFTGSTGTLAGSFVDVRANTVSGESRAAPRHLWSSPRGTRRRGGVVMSPVFSHGDLRLYILSLLDEEPRHGYDLMQALSERTGAPIPPPRARSIRVSPSSRKRGSSPRASTAGRPSTRSPMPAAPKWRHARATSRASRPDSPTVCG